MFLLLEMYLDVTKIAYSHLCSNESCSSYGNDECDLSVAVGASFLAMPNTTYLNVTFDSEMNAYKKIYVL